MGFNALGVQGSLSDVYYTRAPNSNLIVVSENE